MNRVFLLMALSVLLVACKGDDKTTIAEPTGTMLVKSGSGISDSYNSLLGSLNKNENIHIMQEVDFEVNSRSVNSELAPAKIIFFGNPNMGTSLLQRNQLSALDLPYRVYLFEQDGETYAMYNSKQYLESRYQLQGVPELEKISQAVQNMTNTATGAQVRESGEQVVSAGAGIITIESDKDFESTYLSLRDALLENTNWNILTAIDHRENASGVGMQLRPTLVFLLSNSHLESSMLRNNPTAGLDFPQKMLVWEDENGNVKISYNDPNFIERRHSMTESDSELGETATVFNYMANYAASDIED